jgi:DNA-binding NtrC family response regulator
MGGIETLRAIKKKTPLTEVVMLTGHASLEVAREGMENGAFDYLMKPVDIDDLLYKIQDAFHKKTIQEAKIKTLNMMLKSESSPTE